MGGAVGHFPREYFPGKSEAWDGIAEDDYKKIFNHDIAISYLEHGILGSVGREMDQILERRDPPTFHAGLGFLFAEVTYPSHLYCGVRTHIRGARKAIMPPATRDTLRSYSPDLPFTTMCSGTD